MLQVLKNAYRRYFSDPQAVILAMLIIAGFSVVILMGSMLLPVFAGIVIAYLLDDVVSLMERYHAKRKRSVWLVFFVFLAILMFIIFGLIPLLSTQITKLVGELPEMIARGQQLLITLPKHYSFITEAQVSEVMHSIQRQFTDLGQNLLSFSVAQLPGLITTIVYLVLMPLLVLFFLKDKELILNWAQRFLPQERSLMRRVWTEMDHQIGNYVRGKFWEIIIVGVVTGAVFSIMGMNYALLLGALVGLSVIVPYVGAVVVTFPVVIIAFFQWGWTADFAWAVLAYGIVQALDGSVLVPLMFSEVVNLHPIAIIVAVLVFGGLWGFWGVFFAIPLASFVQAIITAWPETAADASGSKTD